MILQALYEYYERNKDKLPQPGFQEQEIKFVVVLSKDGKFLDLLDMREGRKGKLYILPKSVKRSGSNSWQSVNLLWDHYGYLFEHPKDDSPKSLTMAKKQRDSFVNFLKSLPAEVASDDGVRAVIAFYDSSEWEKVKEHQSWPDCIKIPGCNFSFKLDSDEMLIPERDAVKKYQALTLNGNRGDENGEEEKGDDLSGLEAICLITGKKGGAARLHTPTPILGSRSNAKIVAFQKNSGFDSYYKEQAFNAPISIEAESAYSTALKFLTRSRENQVRVGDSTILFWAQKNNVSDVAYDFESEFAYFFRSEKDDPDRGVRAIKGLYEAFNSGKLPASNLDNRFYVLGLSPNAARISIRFWKTGAIKDFAENIKRHFDDFEVVRGPKDNEYLSLYQILSATAAEYKMDNVPPNLAGKVVESILDGSPYPVTLMQQCVRRIRADVELRVNRTRAAILKAYLNRFNRFYNVNEREVFMSLDRSNENTGYRLGRLFAVLEKIQEESSPGVNATIRDRFYGAASTTPTSVFPRLLKLKNHHITKLNPGRQVNMEKEIGEIVEGLQNELPATLTLDEQARFAIGYYHQRQDFFKKKD